MAQQLPSVPGHSPAPRGRIVLIHGAAHGAWCWERIVPLLEARGFNVDAVDLPGLGDDQTPAEHVTFDAYVRRVLEAVRARPEPVLLVGHSMGGGPISQAAENAAEQIEKLLYLTAVLPQNGETPGMMMELSARFRGRSAGTALRPGPAEGTLEFVPEMAAAVFYNQCDPETAASAARRLRPQATGPLQGMPITLTRERWGRIPKIYVLCTEDQALPPDLQRWLCARAAGVKVVERPWDHSPFYSDPRGLAELIAAEAVAAGPAP